MPHVERLGGGGSDTDGAAAQLEADVERLLADRPPEIQAIARALRATVRAAFPEAIESVDFPDRLIAFGRSDRMRGLLFAIVAHASWVNLQLADGADLPDPTGIVEGTGKRIRHVKVRSVEQAASEPVVAIIQAQLAARPSA